MGYTFSLLVLQGGRGGADFIPSRGGRGGRGRDFPGGRGRGYSDDFQVDHPGRVLDNEVEASWCA